MFTKNIAFCIRKLKKKKTSRNIWLKAVFENVLLGSWILYEECGGNVLLLTKHPGFGGNTFALGKQW